jgi:hypothetical protein
MEAHGHDHRSLASRGEPRSSSAFGSARRGSPHRAVERCSSSLGPVLCSMQRREPLVVDYVKTERTL